MADVMGSLRSAADRGQLLLVTALALAVLLVTVALLLNTAIFTENVATRDTTADGHEAIELRGELVDAVGTLIETENYRRSGSTATVETGVETMGIDAGGESGQKLVERERGRYGTIANLTHNDSDRGQLLRWNDTDTNRPFDVDDGNWTLVESLNASRNVTLTLDPETLEQTTASESVDDDAFAVRFNRSGETVTQYIYNQSGSGDLAIAESVNGSSPERQCQIDHNNRNTTVDLTGDRLSTDESAVDCFRGLWPDDDPDAIEFVNGDNAEGGFAATVDEDASPTDKDDVQHSDAVYSVTVDVAYTTADLNFETTVRVAPGEPR